MSIAKLLKSGPFYPVYRLHGLAHLFVCGQVFSVLLLAIALWLFKGSNAGYSAVLGGAVAIMPNFYFAKRLFAQTGAQVADKILRAFYVGEAMKLLLTAGLCAFILMLVPVSALAFFSGFILAQMAFFWVPLIKDKEK